MENLSGKGKVAEKRISGIKESRLNSLKTKYIPPETKEFSSGCNLNMKDCSDMASCGVSDCCYCTMLV